ncbi:MAG: FkbM family methyltransferase [Betaproteobacteria bacterium HGW-Betaproteobacteria-7]|jgi:FkbM family methyltransferase|nr:MAG: FkbM family methyltransferase [Betaproteobacteria bacterium HGW-Betaproteobacteria-7]
MNALIKIREAFEAGHTGKQDYIESIHARHECLFNYPEFISHTDVESVTIQADGIFIRSRSQQIELVLDPRDQHLVPCTLMNFGHYEPDETALLKAIVQPNWTILDIGANCGWYALSLAKHCPSAQIHGFEPIPSTYEILKHNIRHNGLNNIAAHQLALSNQEKTVEFFHTPSCSGATSLALAGQPTTVAPLEKVSAISTTLDTFCAQHGLAPQLIKCDVEGAELMVIQGGERTISVHKPVILVELLRKWSEKFGYHPNDVIALLGKHGYRAFKLRADGLAPSPNIDEETQETNFIFLHEQQHQHIFTF